LAEGWSTSRDEDEALAEQLILEALERDANRPAAHYALGMLRRVQNRLDQARMEFETTIALDRNHARSFFRLGQTLMFLGQPEEGISHIEKSIRLNPRDPNIAMPYAILGIGHFLLGRVDRGSDLLRRARAANPRFWWLHLVLAGALGFKGDLDEARSVAEAVRPDMSAGFSIDQLHIDSHLVASASHAAFKHVANTKLAADPPYVDGFALIR
jgi:tetratricopeptide (TPR) repeat protein